MANIFEVIIDGISRGESQEDIQRKINEELERRGVLTDQDRVSDNEESEPQKEEEGFGEFGEAAMDGAAKMLAYIADRECFDTTQQVDVILDICKNAILYVLEGES